MKQFTENHMDNYNQKTEICYISIKKESVANEFFFASHGKTF